MIDLSHSPLRRQFEFVAGHDAAPTNFVRQVSISFGEKVGADGVRRAWDAVVAVTPTLRGAESGAAASVDTESATVPGSWQEIDWSGLAGEAVAECWGQFLEADAVTPFATSPMQRVSLILLPDDGIHLLWSSDARELDYGSLTGTLIRWFAACDLIESGQPVDWPQDNEPSDILARVADRPQEADEAFWKDHLSAFTAPLRPVLFPLAPREESPVGTRASVQFTFERAERMELAKAADGMGVSLATLGRAAWAFLVSQVCGSHDVSLAESLDADPDSELSQTAGRFESWLPRRIMISSDQSSMDFCASLDAWFVDSARYLAPDTIAGSAGVLLDEIFPSAAYLFRDGTLNDTLRRALPRWMAADVCIYEKATHPLTLLWTDTDRPVIELGYDPAQFSASAARDLLDRWVLLVRTFVESPDLSLRRISLLLPGEGAVVRGVESATAARSLVPQCLHEAINDIAIERADHVAVECGGESMLYSKLTSQSNQLARYLQKNGVSPGDAVGMAMGRSPWWVVALLGAWKAGAKVVLIQPNALNPMVSEIPLKAVLQDIATAASIEVSDGVKRITVDAGWSAIGGEKTRALSIAIEHDAPAMVAISSESSDDPITLSHDELLASAIATAQMLELSATDRLLQFAPTDLPSAAEEVLAALLIGGTLVLRPDDVLSTRTAFHEFVSDAGISALILPTAFWGEWLHYLTELSARLDRPLRLVVVVGWRVLPTDLAAWEKAAPSTALMHVTTDRGLIGLGFSSENIPLGSVYAPVHARIVNANGEALPPGFAGLVGCAFASNKRDIPAEAFHTVGRNAFRTHDGRFLAREWVDTELGAFSVHNAAASIEWVACQHSGVSSAVAALRDIDGSQCWCVWIVPLDSIRGEPLDFRASVAAKLPAALTPSRVGCLQRLPLTRSGAVDFAALPEPTSDVPVFSGREERGSEEEETLRTVLGKVLGGRMLRLDEMIREGKSREAVAQSLCDAVVQSGFAAQLADFTVPFSIRSLMRNIRSRRPMADSGWIPLKPLRMSGNLPPMVLIHDFPGNAKVCESLAAALGEDQPCYAITARGLVEPARSHATVEEMARDYVAAIKAMDPDGPHSIVGIGFGGLIAFECARLLDAEGLPPRLVVVLGTEPPVTSVAVRGLRVLSRNLFKSLRGGRSDAPAEAARAGKSHGSSPLVELNQSAASNYAPAGGADFIMHAFVPDQEFASFRDVQSGWNAVCTGVNYYQVPCTVRELLEEPAVTAVGRALLDLVQSDDDFDEDDSTGA
jgi:aspartate racemase